MAAWETTNFPLPDEAQALARLPARHGGLGLLSAAAHCGIAFAAASVSSAALLPRLIPASAHVLAQPDPRLVDDATVSLFPPVASEVARYLEAATPIVNAQKMLSKLLSAAQATVLLANVGDEAAARMLSAAAPHANAWLSPLPGAPDPAWLSPAEHDVAIRLRLGLPIAEAPSLCGNCGRTWADVHGRHALACMHGPNRWAVHNAVRDAVYFAAGAALWAPVREPMLDSAADRADVLFRVRAPGGAVHRIVVDVAVVSDHMEAAVRSPGGAATECEEVKRARYGAAADRAGATLVPLIVDTNGAWGASSLPLFRQLAGALARRDDMGFGRALSLLMAEMSARLMRGIAACVLRTHSASRACLV